MDLVQGAQAFQILAAHLKETGEGKLRADLQKAIKDAAKPIADMIGNTSHLREYMPNRYADVLATDLQVSTHARAGGTSPGITIMARAPTAASGGRGARKIRQREAGVITHPLWGNREHWYPQTAGMSAGFFSDPGHRMAPQVRDKILEAMRGTCDEITRKA